MPRAKPTGMILLWSFLCILSVRIIVDLAALRRPVTIVVYNQPGHEADSARVAKAISRHLGLPGFKGE